MQIQETFECRNCYYSGPLDDHGRCPVCESSAVISLHLLDILLSATAPQIVIAGRVGHC